jgi:peptide/nickel transport system permease protein
MNKPLLIGLSSIIALAALAILAPLVSPYDPALINQAQLLTAPSGAHLLGTFSAACFTGHASH